MPSGSDLNRFSDDDFFNGGPCPSCRLAIDKETGRLKWCTGGSEARRFRIKLMLLIPAVLLLTIVFIALSRFQATTKASDSRAVSTFYEMREQDKEIKIENDVFWTTSRNDVERTAEESEEEDRLLLPDMKTSYVPVDTHPPFRSQSPHRRKRDIDGENQTRDGFELDDRATSSSRAHVRLANGKLTDSLSREESDGKNDASERSFSASDSVQKIGDTIESNNARDINEEDNFLGDYYPEEEAGDTYESSGIKCNYRTIPNSRTYRC